MATQMKNQLHMVPPAELQPDPTPTPQVHGPCGPGGTGGLRNFQAVQNEMKPTWK